VFRGEIWLKRQDLADVVTMLTLATRPITSRSPVHLTPRQYEVLKILASGGTNREVARILSVSQDTVKHHITKILDKTGMSSRVELALYAVEHGMLDLPDVRSPDGVERRP
jgi:DNA-binding NarL/FixJ family response regulator